MSQDVEALSMPRRLMALALAHPVAAALVVFAASRVIVWLGVMLADRIIAPATGPGLWHVGEWWFHRLLRWDAGWYMGIVDEGYRLGETPQVEASIVFFPLLPVLAKGLAAVTGLRHFDALLVVANVSAVTAIALLAALVRRKFGPRIAVLSAALLAFAPSSVFLSSAYTEAPTLIFVLLVFLAMERGWLWAAAVAAGFATAARLTCVAAVAALTAHVVVAGSGGLPRRLLLAAVLGLVGMGGLFAFMGWQAWTFGDPFAFLRYQEAWSGPLDLRERLWRMATLWPLLQLNYGVPWLVGCAALVAAGARRLPWTWTLYAGLTILIPYATVGTGLPGLGSFSRYVLITFPITVSLALLLNGRPRLTAALLTAAATGLFVTTAVFSQWHFVG